MSDKKFDWQKVEFKLLGKTIEGITGIDYTGKITMGLHPADVPKPPTIVTVSEGEMERLKELVPKMEMEELYIPDMIDAVIADMHNQQELCIKEVLRQLLGVEPTIEEHAPKCTFFIYPPKFDGREVKDFSYNGMLLGQVIINMGYQNKYGVEFIHDKAFKQ